RDLYSSDLALRFERSWSPEQLASIWGPMLAKAPRLGLPAVLGLDSAGEIHGRLEQLLGIEIFEIPTLPPSVPGLRLERTLRRHALLLGCRIVEGAHVIGRIDGRSGGSRVLGVVAETAAGPRAFDADAVLLATGGFLHGGLRASRGGSVVDSVFGLPIRAPADREQWFGDRCLAAHPYDLLGLNVNDRLQPVDRRGEPYYSNVFACGGILGGVDRRAENCRQGIDLATAYAAVGSIAA
ncbi:MAG TPA: FAD-binding protein, partial [Anaerolineales bacterium]|nr:FAD-binding protein [Anaerolineales bacterium]